MSTAKVINFPVGGKKVADLDDGYTRIANDLYDALIAADLTKHQQKVAHAYVRMTYGYNKKNDRIADDQIAVKTKLPRCKVNTAKNELLDMKVLILDGRKIGVNKNISEWNINKSYQNSNSIQNGNTVTKTVTKNVTKTVITLLPKTEHTKDIISKDNKDNNILLDSAFEIFYKAGLPKVGKSKAITSFKTAYKNWKSENKTPEVFAQMLVSDIQCRLKANIFGFANLHPTTYLNQKRWEDELPANARRPQPQMTPEQKREYELYMFMQGEN
ncbi:hypothetical protein B6D23_05340 [Gilliamella sp. N-W3]|uniref:replication protein n=1 Tax=Gilliamella sp. N-W3 TaxID=1970474 RepID=UPI000A32C811|nr:replication protein [Gilliamella sp. N-W3]OTQ79458.1 hypothetical protein B6D23_05340 [Gilliamella sp. N-W3]